MWYLPNNLLVFFARSIPVPWLTYFGAYGYWMLAHIDQAEKAHIHSGKIVCISACARLLQLILWFVYCFVCIFSTPTNCIGHFTILYFIRGRSNFSRTQILFTSMNASLFTPNNRRFVCVTAAQRKTSSHKYTNMQNRPTLFPMQSAQGCSTENSYSPTRYGICCC